MMKNAFYFILKLFSFSRYLNFWPDFFCQVGKGLDKKAKVNFKTSDVTGWRNEQLQYTYTLFVIKNFGQGVMSEISLNNRPF